MSADKFEYRGIAAERIEEFKKNQIINISLGEMDKIKPLPSIINFNTKKQRRNRKNISRTN